MSLPTLDNLAPKEAGGAATKFPGIVADLDTRPNAIGGLSAAELKAKFDEAARVIQNYINNVLLPALLSSGATSIGYQASAADLPDYRPDTVSDALAGLESLVASLLPIKNNGKVCFCNNLTIPSSGSISVAYNSIYPRPLAGDYVVNQNGEMGHITSVVIGDVVTVTAANYTLKTVLTDETQNLSATQKARARSNIGALGTADTEAKYVKYDDYASYTDTQKATARANIGALEKANPHVETRMTVDGVLDAEGGIEAYDDVTVEGALIVKASSQENGVSVSQTDAAVLSFAGATPQTKPVLRNIAGPVMNNDAATKAYVDAADAAQAQHAAETYLPKENPAATGELTVGGELTVADALGNEVHVQAGSGNAMVLQGGSNHAGTVEIKGVGTPTADSSAAPKGYVDTQIAGVNKILLYDGTISATAGDTAALSATSFSPQNAILGDVVVGTNGYTASVQTKLTPTMFVVRSTGQQFAPGGGGGAGMELFLVTFTYTAGVGVSSDKTLAQITAAKNAGKYVEGVFAGQYCPLVKLTNEQALFQRLATSGTVVDLEWISVGANGCMADVIPIEMAETAETVADIAATIQPEDNHIYNCGELTSLTIDSPPSTGAWSVVFTSGSTATTTTIPSTILGLEDFAAEANTAYEINVLDNRAVVGSWEVASA